ncbi:putative quorum-sensing-regulated virulence factor [Mesorhizobium sp. Cs1299R1N3]|uniref:putative quorum-sensing-regulated virulence factor n=1 Tax=Mesorhizobium sp. Cs1299R1N3 TaxID=3015173 RepID=UPI00301DE916
MTATFRTLDIETSGINAAEHEILQIGWRDAVQPEAGAISLAPWYDETFVKNTKPIPIEASAIHQIVESDLTVAPPRDLAVDRVKRAVLYVAHNAAFEASFLPELQPWACTFKTALRLAPDAKQHNVQYLRYHFGVALSRDERENLFPHRAGADAYVTAPIFLCLLRLAPLEELLRISALPPLFKRFAFGKHKGEPIADVPLDYFNWVQGEGTFDDGVLHSIAVERARRMDGDHETYFGLACKVLEFAESRAMMVDWWKGEAINRAKHYVVEGTPLYRELVARCAAKTATFVAEAA